MLREYLRLATFALSMLIGLQLPGFMNQYQQRVDAHLKEAQHNLGGFRQRPTVTLKAVFLT